QPRRRSRKDKQRSPGGVEDELHPGKQRGEREQQGGHQPAPLRPGTPRVSSARLHGRVSTTIGCAGLFAAWQTMQETFPEKRPGLTFGEVWISRDSQRADS